MKRIALLIGTVALSACTSSSSPQGMQGMHGDHGGMQTGGGMMHGGTQKDPLAGIDLATVKEPSGPAVLSVNDGDTIDLTARPGKAFVAGKERVTFTYNGHFPGPQIEAVQGSTFTVRFTNDLPVPTMVHWHGVRLENKYDGSMLTQKEVQPGDEFVYKVHVPDSGLFWYHPHVREDVQQDLGLYGALLVRPKGARPAVSEERVVTLDDIAVAADGSLLSYGDDEANHALMGRYGTALLTDGRDAETYAHTVEQNRVVRLYVLNAASARPFRIAIPKARMKLVGLDGGLLPQEEFVEQVTLGPSERAIIDVLFSTSGPVLMISDTPAAKRTLMTFAIVPSQAKDDAAIAAFNATAAHPAVAQEIAAVQGLLAKEPDHTLELDLEMMGMGGGMMMQGMDHSMHTGGGGDGIEWEDAMGAMNAQSAKPMVEWKLVDKATGKENMDIRYAFTKGSTAKIRVVNRSDTMHPMQHPIHFHGQRFLAFNTDGTPFETLGWKDTVQVPAGKTIDLLVPMENAGDWMIHCHIAEHLSNGMMATFTVR